MTDPVVYTPRALRTAWKGELIRNITAERDEETGVVQYVRVRMLSGNVFHVIPRKGAFITETLINITNKAKPITGIHERWEADGAFEMHVYASRNRRQMIVRGTGITLDDYPFEIQVVES